MSKTYRIHGARYLRKYSAAEKSSCYSYMADVRKIANTLCTVPWERVSGDIPATTTIHTEEGLDWNEPERDRFDAAEWCGEHSDGYHRAFAQAACYVFKLPDSAVGKSIEGLRVNVTSDPYNPYGARIAAMTSETLDIPMDCDTVRQGEMFRGPDEDGLGAAPRIFVKDAKTGKETWYSNNEIVELTPGETLTAKRYLFVFVCLENYNRGRDGWIEGSSYIDNDVEITLSAAASDLVDDELNDLTPDSILSEFHVCSGENLPALADEVSGVQAVEVGIDGGGVESAHTVDELFGVNSCIGLRTAYGFFYTGQMNQLGSTEYGLSDCVRPGAAFSVSLRKSDGDRIVNGKTWELVNSPMDSFSSVAYGNGVFVLGGAGGGRGLLYSRGYGSGWNAVTASGIDGNGFEVVYGDGVFVASGKSMNVGLWYSDDGISWTKSAYNGNKGFGRPSYGNGVFVVSESSYGGAILYSKDRGRTWNVSEGDFGNRAFRVTAFGNGVFLAASDGDIFQSKDNGETWSLCCDGSYGSEGMCYGDGVFVGAGEIEGLWYSKDNGITWTNTATSNISSRGNDFNIAYGNGVFVAVTNGNGIWYSTDHGETWNRTTTSGAPYNNARWISVGYGNGVFIATGAVDGIWCSKPAVTEGNTSGVWKLMTSVLFVRTSVPIEFRASKVRLDWSAWKGTATDGSRFNVWMRRGYFAAGYNSDIIKNHVIYDAESDRVGDYELIGTIDAADGSRSVTFDLKETLVGEVVTFLLSAFVSMDRINPSGCLSLPRGVSAIQDVDMTEKTVSGLEMGWRPDITLLG